MDRIYYYLSSLYGDELHDFLLGVNGMNSTNLFNLMFVILLIISAGLIPGFYYKLWDRAEWAVTGKWMLMLSVNATLVFLIDVIWVDSLRNLMVDEEGNPLMIGMTNIVGYGFASAILATIIYFIASLGWKTQSTNCPNTPF